MKQALLIFLLLVRYSFTIKNGQLIILTNGGHKGTQRDDIQKAKEILNRLED